MSSERTLERTDGPSLLAQPAHATCCVKRMVVRSLLDGVSIESTGRRGQDSNPHTVPRETAFKAVAIPFRSPLRADAKYIRYEPCGHILVRDVTNGSSKSEPSTLH